MPIISDLTTDKNVDIYGCYQALKSTVTFKDDLELKYNKELDQEDVLKNLRNSSKLNQYYRTVIDTYKIKLSARNNIDCINKYYNERFFRVIENRLHLSCLWSGKF
jgi:hypothetical protein